MEYRVEQHAGITREFYYDAETGAFQFSLAPGQRDKRAPWTMLPGRYDVTLTSWWHNYTHNRYFFKKD